MGNASEVEKPVWRGEAALLLAVIVNSFGVVLMLYSGSGISAISSVPFAFSEVFPQLSLGTWTYIFQGLLIASLMVLRKRFVLQYVFSFAVGFLFGELLDRNSAGRAAGARVLFRRQLPADQLWNCAFQPLLPAHCPDGSFSAGAGADYRIRVSGNQDFL